MTTSSTPPLSPAALAALQARLQEALTLHRQGRLLEARGLYEGILRDYPQQPDTLHLLGVLHLQGGDAAAAERHLGAAVAAQPDNPEFHLNRATALRALQRADAALESYDRALALQPELVNGHLGRATALKELGRGDDAVAAYGQALALQPDFAEVHFNLGNLLRDLARLEAAQASFERALALKPELVAARVNLAAVRLQRGEAEAALADVDAALAQRSDLAEAHVIRGNALFALQRCDDAVASYDRALALKPDHFEALLHRGKTQYRLLRDEAARASVEAALALQPEHVDAHLLHGTICQRLLRHDAALAAFERVITLAPGQAEGWYNKGVLLQRLHRSEEAVACMAEAERLHPGHSLVQGQLLHARMFLCDWTDFDASLARVEAAMARDEVALLPFASQSLIDSPALQLQVAYKTSTLLPLPAALPGGFPPRAPGAKIRLGYFSADFREHPVAQLTASLFEHHDRGDFEVIGFAFGPPADDFMRQRLEQAFDRLFDVADLAAPDVARLAREQRIDIAIDLGGFTRHCRPEIFACRAAPLQVSYIGYLGTMGVPFMDYLVADAVLIPAALRDHYAEQIVTLPWYQANDRTRRVSDRVFSRAELGLPETGLVFASFNNQYKITPPVFDRWMRILKQVDDSVLYLLVDNDTARHNLRAEAEARGVDGARLHFAGRVPPPDYLARYRVIDLFLDTWPCNAGATASDALCMGVPVLTCQGQAFPSRIASSVLTALQMPELITTSPDAYERRAVELARDPAQLAALRAKVAQQREHGPFFDIPRFTRHLEAAFRAMQARRDAGLAPAHIVIGE
jgi:predicted O-linked N-acetylglucosamine transferase (SPINDLY family)